MASFAIPNGIDVSDMHPPVLTVSKLLEPSRLLSAVADISRQLSGLSWSQSSSVASPQSIRSPAHFVTQVEASPTACWRTYFATREPLILFTAIGFCRADFWPIRIGLILLSQQIRRNVSAETRGPSSI